MNSQDVYAAEMMRREVFAAENLSSLDKRKEVEATLRSLYGVGEVGFVPNGVEVSYFPQIIGADMVRSAMDRLGLHSAVKKKGWLARTMDRMAENNRKEFGDKPLDCCTIDKGKSCK